MVKSSSTRASGFTKEKLAATQAAAEAEAWLGHKFDHTPPTNLFRLPDDPPGAMATGGMFEAAAPAAAGFETGGLFADSSDNLFGNPLPGAERVGVEQEEFARGVKDAAKAHAAEYGLAQRWGNGSAVRPFRPGVGAVKAKGSRQSERLAKDVYNRMSAAGLVPKGGNSKKRKTKKRKTKKNKKQKRKSRKKNSKTKKM